MKINCPHGYKAVMKLGAITWEDRTVTIHSGVCDTAGECGIKSCRFYDTSHEATRRFQRARAPAQAPQPALTTA